MTAETHTIPDAIDLKREAAAERGFQSTLQPLVSRAWDNHCRRFMIDPANKMQRESWYRDTMQTVVESRSSKGLDPEQRRGLLRHFNMLANMEGSVIVVVVIDGWSARQSEQYTLLARKAFSRIRMRGEAADQWDAWRPAQFKAAAGCDESTRMVERTATFDRVMAHFAQIANDEYWMRRTAQADEGRMRFQIRQYMQDLAYLEGREIDWNYIRGIWRQTKLMPDLEDAPADLLAKVLGMLDTHIRRLCKKAGMKPIELPTRGGSGVKKEEEVPF